MFVDSISTAKASGRISAIEQNKNKNENGSINGSEVWFEDDEEDEAGYT